MTLKLNCAAVVTAMLAIGAAPQIAEPQAPAAGVQARSARTIDRRDLERLVDSVMAAGMARERIPGAAIAIVSRGRVVLEKGYGFQDVAPRHRVDPRETLFPFASITKVVTATALMQLVERGKVNLESDVNMYLRAARVPASEWPPITVAHLLSHTDALDELPGRRVATRGELRPLREFLRTKLVRFDAPGNITRYGTYGIALAGLILEEVSGVSYAQYVQREVFRPLRMFHTTIDKPVRDRGAFATPYERADGTIRVSGYEWYQTTPTSSMVSTVADMARFAAFHLGDPVDEPSSHVLGIRWIHEMATQHATVHAGVPGWGYGWQLDDANGLRILEHGGDIGGFSTLLTLLPDENVGIVIAHHLEGSDLRFAVKAAILDRFFPDRRPPFEPPSLERTRGQFAGTYLANNYCRTCPDGAARAQRFEITENSDGSIELWGARWYEIAPLLFSTGNGKRKLGFKRDSSGRIIAASAGAWRVIEPAPGS